MIFCPVRFSLELQLTLFQVPVFAVSVIKHGLPVNLGSLWITLRIHHT